MRRSVQWVLGGALLVGVLLGRPCPGIATENGQATGEGAAGPVFVQMQPIVLPIVQGDRVTRTAGVVLSLELVKGKTEADLEPKRVKLRDAFITTLYAYMDQHSEEPRAIDAEAVKRRLEQTSERVLGPGVVRQVLIQQAFERPRR